MTPDEMRALAERVENGEDGLQILIAKAMGIEVQPIPYFHLNIEDSNILWEPLRQRGWTLQVYIMQSDVDCAAINRDRAEYDWWGGSAPTEARARTAIALRCRADELEIGEGEAA